MLPCFIHHETKKVENQRHREQGKEHLAYHRESGAAAGKTLYSMNPAGLFLSGIIHPRSPIDSSV